MNSSTDVDHEAMEHHDVLGLPDGQEQPDGPLLRLIKDKRIAFLAVGGFNTVIGLGTFAIFNHVFGDHLALVSLVCSHIVSVIIAFVLYRSLVFKVRGNVIGDFLRFETVYLVGLAVNAILLSIAVHGLHYPALPSQFVVTALQAVWSWVGHDRFSFRRPKDSA